MFAGFVVGTRVRSGGIARAGMAVPAAADVGWSALVLGETIGWTVVVAGLGVIASVAVTQRARVRRR
jgi:drug/metabolite transporter (DMT)-like permease